MLNESVFSNKQKIGIILIIVLMIAMVLSPACLADSPFDTVESALSQVYDSVRAISTGIALLLAACALVTRMFSKNPQAKAQSTGWLIAIVIGWIAIQMLGTILTWLEGMFPST